MKITNKKLKQIIKEELRNLILEFNSSDERTDRFIQFFIETISSLVHAQPEDFYEDDSFFDSHTENFYKLIDVGILNNLHGGKLNDNEVRYVIDFPHPEQDKELHKKIEDAYIENIKTANPKMIIDGHLYSPTQEGEYCVVKYEYLGYMGRIIIDIVRKEG